jgi:hypothetical protein
MKALIGRQYSFKEVSKFSLENKMLHHPASNIDAFVSGATALLLFT